MKFKTLLFGALAFFALNTMAETITEGFETVTIVDADSWGYGTTLSNGWVATKSKSISPSADTDYCFWSTAHSGSKSFCAKAGSSNNTYIVVPVLLSGDVTFYYRKTSSSAGKVYVYKVTESDGTYTIGSSLFSDQDATTSWQQCTSIHLTEPTMIAFRMIRAAIDDVTYTTASLEPHEHNYASEWSYDENEHWHACTSTVGICDAKKIDVAAHDGLTCSVCGYKTPGIESFPWTEDFEGITSGIPAGWDNSEGTATTRKWALYSGYTEGKSVRFDSYNNYTGITNVLATPLIYVPIEGVYELKFKVKNPMGGNYEVKIAEYGSAERTTLFDNLTNISSWTEKTVSLASYRGKAVKVYFCGTSNYGSGDAYLYLDDVTVKETIAHVHKYDKTWSNDNKYHWHACMSDVGECDAQKADLAAHTFDANGICTVCGYDLPYSEDFENGIPAWWTNNGWKIATGTTSDNKTKMAYSYTSSNPIVTPLLQAKAGDEIHFDLLQEWQDEAFVAEYQINGTGDWSEILSIEAGSMVKINKYTTYTWTAPADGNYRLRFAGKYYYLDNVTGFKLAPETRATATSRFGTVCLPYDASTEGATLYTAAVSDDGTWLELTEASMLEAGVAYIYQATANAQTFSMSGNVAYSPSNEGILKGFYTSMKAIAGTYVMQTHEGVQQFYLVEAGSEPTLAPYRAYLEVNLPGDARTIGWNMGNEETAIEVLNAAVEQGQIYDLNGRKLSRLQKGINIVNGRKVLVK